MEFIYLLSSKRTMPSVALGKCLTLASFFWLLVLELPQERGCVRISMAQSYLSSVENGLLTHIH